MRPSPAGRPSCRPSQSFSPHDALIGRVVRLRLRPETDRVVDELWAAGFALAESAEVAVSGAPLTVALGDQVVTAGRRLWTALDGADELYCSLASMCSTKTCASGSGS